MTGTPMDPGIVPQTLQEVFNYVDQVKWLVRVHACTRVGHKLCVMCIYNCVIVIASLVHRSTPILLFLVVWKAMESWV